MTKPSIPSSSSQRRAVPRSGHNLDVLKIHLPGIYVCPLPLRGGIAPRLHWGVSRYLQRRARSLAASQMFITRVVGRRTLVEVFLVEPIRRTLPGAEGATIPLPPASFFLQMTSSRTGIHIRCFDGRQL